MASFLQGLRQQFPIVDPKTGQPTDYFMRLLQKQGSTIGGDIDTNTAAIALKADKSIVLTAGTGLTGGGDLSADRTFAIDTSAEAERIRDTIGAALVAGSNITITVNDAGDTITIAASGGAGTLDGAKAHKSAALTAQNLTTAAPITWNSEDWDTGGYHDNSSNTDRFTVTNAGYYLCSAQLQLLNISSGNWVLLELRRFNSSNVQQEQFGMQRSATNATGTHELNVSGETHFDAGDYLKVYASVQTDTSVDINTTSWGSIRRVG